MTYLLCQDCSAIARPAAIHLSKIASRNKPMQAPKRAPGLLGTQYWNQRVSERGEKWRKAVIWPCWPVMPIPGIPDIPDMVDVGGVLKVEVEKKTK